MSLIEVIISSGLTLIILFAVGSFINGTIKSALNIQQSIDSSNLRWHLDRFPLAPEMCKSSAFGGITYDGNAVTIPSLKWFNKFNSTVYELAPNSSQWGIKVNSIMLTPFNGIARREVKLPNSPPLWRYQVELTISYERKNLSNNDLIVKKMIKTMAVDTLQSNNEIISCNNQGSLVVISCDEFGATDTGTGCSIPPGTRAAQLGSCTPGNFIQRINFDGTPQCEPFLIHNADFGFTYVSGNVASCPPNTIANRFKCTNNNCGSGTMSYGCTGFPSGLLSGAPTSSPDTKNYVCPSGKAMISFDCTGSCGTSNMRASCQLLSGVDTNDRILTAFGSNAKCPAKYVACGFKCNGGCGNSTMAFYCCRLHL